MQIGGRAACGAPALLCDAYKTLFLPALLLSVEVQNVAGGTAEVIAIKKRRGRTRQSRRFYYVENFIPPQGVLLNNTLCHHCVGNLLEARNVGAHYVVALKAVFFCRVVYVVVDIYHYPFELCVYLFESPEHSAR